MTGSACELESTVYQLRSEEEECTVNERTEFPTRRIELESVWLKEPVNCRERGTSAASKLGNIQKKSTYSSKASFLHSEAIARVPQTEPSEPARNLFQTKANVVGVRVRKLLIRRVGLKGRPDSIVAPDTCENGGEGGSAGKREKSGDATHRFQRTTQKQEQSDPLEGEQQIELSEGSTCRLRRWRSLELFSGGKQKKRSALESIEC